MKSRLLYSGVRASLFICALSSFLSLKGFAGTPAPPTNDNCSGATTLTSGTSCNNIQYNLKDATASTGFPAGCATASTHYDVWFRFTAVMSSQTVTISGFQTNFTNPEIQLYSGTCAGLTSVACGTTSVFGSGLTVGNTYYVRVSQVGGSTLTSQAKFNICVTHPPALPSNDNCGSATLLTSASACSSTSSNLYYASSSSPAGTCGSATATTTYDVWFSFVATSTTQTVTLSGLGSRLTTAATYMQLLSGVCGSQTSVSCQTAATRMTNSGLTVGATYYVRVYVTSNPTGGISSDWNFYICVQQPPANDDCAGAISLTPGVTCSNTAGTLDLSTVSTGFPAGCAAGTNYDVWYRFVAVAGSQTITLSTVGSSITAPRIQVYSGTCAGLTSMGCASATTMTQTGLTIGNTYYVRISNNGTNPSGTGTVASFNICITNAAAAPSNDLCSGAISLTSNTTCSNISGTLLRATATAGLPACGNASSADVWYSFVAQTAYPTFTLSGVGTDMTSAAPRIQIFSGSVCGLMTSLGCAASPFSTRTTIGGAGLAIGTTYYVRITTNTNTGTPTSGNWGFSFCITDPVGAVVDYAKSYVNITDGTAGGTINPGDELEIRATMVVQRSVSPLVHQAVDSLAFYDTLEAGKGFAFKAASIALRTNEGKLYKSFTDGLDTDAGWYTSGGPGTDTAIQINFGTNASNTARGKLRSASRPSFYNNTCIIVATYRVIVNAGYGTKINFGGGKITYRDSATGDYNEIIFPNDSLIVFESVGICPNSVTESNILGDEYNGTFGTATGSPTLPQNRGTSTNTNYTYATFASSAPQDYFYGIANNTSAAGSTVQTLAKGNAARVHTVWDISGDHTGATNTSKGNKPCDLTQPVSASNPCGYMLVVNAAYKTDLAFNFTVTGACPNSYYEISAWLKNICYKCGCDSAGRGPTTAGYIPTATGDSSGVRPNLAFQIDGIDYYTTGDIEYQGLGGTQTGSDTLNNWVKRAFVYRTGAAQTSFTLTIRNNAPGGGGNDWALDDLSLRTCFPNMSYSPTSTPTVCEGNNITIYDTVRSYYNTYVEYKWQRSTDGGVTWADIAGTTATASPTLSGGMYEYIASYTLPPSYTTAANNGDLYRVVVATTTANLASGSCNFSDSVEINLNVLSDCGPVLSTDFLSVSGRLIENKARISWVTEKEIGPIKYNVERSDDGINYYVVGTVNGYNDFSADKNYYSFDDPRPVSGKVFYRIAVMSGTAVKKYSRTVPLSLIQISNWGLGTVVNPFDSELQYEISSPVATLAKVELIDNFGKTIRSSTQHINAGVNALIINNTGIIPTGIYLLKVQIGENVAIRKVMKGSR